MASSTDFWFQSDDEFYAAVEDNVVVGQTASMTRQGLREDEPFAFDGTDFDDDDHDENSAPVEEEEYPLKLKDILLNPYHYGNSLGCDADSQLLYADVDNHDSSKLDINQSVAKCGFLEEESDRSKLMKAKLLDHLASLPLGWQSDNFWNTDPDLEYEDSEDEDKIKEMRQKLKKETDERYGKKKDWDTFQRDRSFVERNLERDYGLLCPDKVNYLLSLDEVDGREVLNIFSNQCKRKLKRPVVLLIGAVDKPSMQKPGTKEGWAVVYHFFSNKITVKPFLLDKTHHPLAQNWDTDVPNDGICLTGNPAIFVDKVLQLEADIKSELNEAHTSQILVYYVVARWLILHWKALSAIKDDGQATMTDENREKVSDAKRFMLRESAKIDVPREKPQPAPKKTIRVFEHLQAHLEDYEAAIRHEAIKAKDAGNETAADDAVKLYGKLTEMLQEFNMNAEKDV